MKKTVSGILLMLLLIAMLTFAFSIRPASAQALAVPPTISNISQVPDINSVNDSEAVTVSANVTDNSGTGTANVTIVYSFDFWTNNSTAAMTLNSTDGLYYGTIPRVPIGTTFYVIDAHDNNGGFTESSPPVEFNIMPEYAALSLLLIMIATLALAILVVRKRHGK